MSKSQGLVFGFGILLNIAIALLLQSGLGQDLLGTVSSLIGGNGSPYSGSDHGYDVQVVSRDPLILSIKNFLSDEEIKKVLELSEGGWEESKIYPAGDAYVDTRVRISEMAWVRRSDPVTRRIAERARRLQGWRGGGTVIEKMKAQRYGPQGFFTWHEDYDGDWTRGNRVTTFMVYLNDDFEGGGTNFPRVPRPADPRWCGDVILCGDDGTDGDGNVGTTFKPLKGAAVFWENMYPNGSFHPAVTHASMPVKRGQKLGLNIFGWDKNWTMPVES
ncbi:putative prolyl 4-hydroxylase alpha subunit [Xylariomycetidae sp. FL0641]|nr:putative prolyl 4-hydroxylase alpha subunit [Xylariomycetidae sp. FL0641]